MNWLKEGMQSIYHDHRSMSHDFNTHSNGHWTIQFNDTIRLLLVNL